MHTCFIHQVCLEVQYFRGVNFVITNVRVGNMLLIMALKKWCRCAHFSPLCKSFTVPFVVLWDWMKLGQVVAKNFNVIVDNRASVILLKFEVSIILE